MSKRSLNISEIVFKRNIPSKLETYVFNCDMLRVLAEMDGTKTVAAIAADMNKAAGDLVTILAALYKRKLISIVKPRTTVLPRPVPEVLPAGDAKNLLETRQRTGSLKESTLENPVIENLPVSQKHYRKFKDGSPQTPLNHSEASISTVNAGAPQWKSFTSEPKESDAAPQESRVDIFSINRPGQTGIRPSSTPMSTDGKTNAVKPGKSRVASLAGDVEKGKIDRKAIEYFEKGLALLRRRQYDDAMHQFERSLEIDPQNRLCRANIQRIRLIKEEEKKPYKVFQ